MVPASSTVYQQDGGGNPEVTSYAYSWFAGTLMPQQVITTLPAVLAGQNGSGTAATETTINDIYGRPIWTRNADGYIGNTVYDQATGAVLTQTDEATTGPAGAGWVSAGSSRHSVRRDRACRSGPGPFAEPDQASAAVAAE